MPFQSTSRVAAVRAWTLGQSCVQTSVSTPAICVARVESLPDLEPQFSLCSRGRSYLPGLGGHTHSTKTPASRHRGQRLSPGLAGLRLEVEGSGPERRGRKSAAPRSPSLGRGVSLQEKGEPKEHLIYFLSLRNLSTPSATMPPSAREGRGHPFWEGRGTTEEEGSMLVGTRSPSQKGK